MIAKMGRAVRAENGVGRRRRGWKRFAGLVGLRTLRKDGVKMFVVRLLIEAKGADIDDEFGERRG